MLFKDKIFYFLLVIVLGLIVYLLFFIRTESYECMSNPLQYGVSKVVTKDLFTCRCSILSSSDELIVTKNNSFWDYKLSFYNDNASSQNFNNLSVLD